MNRKILVMAIGISFLLALPALVIRPTNATEVPTTGLDAAYWKGSYFGITSLPTWPGCPASALPGPPAGSPSGTPPTATETDPNINFGSTTGFYWDESYAIGTNPSSDIAGSPGNPGGFAVTDGGYGVALSSWGDPNLYSDYPSSTYFVDTGFSVEWTGYIYLNTGTTYLFQLQSDDGSWLYINTTPGSSTISSANIVINNGAEQPPTTATSGDVSVASTGYYPIEVDYFETCDTQSGIDLSWATVIPSAAPSFSIIPTTAFLPAQIGSNAPTTPTGVPQFSLALPVVAALGFVAFALVRKRTFRRTDATT